MSEDTVENIYEKIKRCCIRLVDPGQDIMHANPHSCSEKEICVTHFEFFLFLMAQNPYFVPDDIFADASFIRKFPFEHAEWDIERLKKKENTPRVYPDRLVLENSLFFSKPEYHLAQVDIKFGNHWKPYNNRRSGNLYTIEFAQKSNGVYDENWQKERLYNSMYSNQTVILIENNFQNGSKMPPKEEYFFGKIVNVRNSNFQILLSGQC